MGRMSIEVARPEVRKGLLFPIQLIKPENGELSLCRCIPVMGIKANQLFLGMPVKKDNLTVNLLNQPSSIWWKLRHLSLQKSKGTPATAEAPLPTSLMPPGGAE